MYFCQRNDTETLLIPVRIPVYYMCSYIHGLAKYKQFCEKLSYALLALHVYVAMTDKSIIGRYVSNYS